MRVSEIMSSTVVAAPASATVEDAARLMLEHGVGSVVVVDEAGGVAGIVTERDFHVDDDPVPETSFNWPRTLGHYVWSEESLQQLYESARTQRLDSLMTIPVVTIEANAGVWDAVQTMAKHDVKRLPVVRDGRLVGLVSRHDLLKLLVRGER